MHSGSGWDPFEKSSDEMIELPGDKTLREEMDGDDLTVLFDKEELDDPEEEGGTPTFGGRKMLIDKKWPILSGGPLMVTGKIQAGARWSQYSIGCFAEGSVREFL